MLYLLHSNISKNSMKNMSVIYTAIMENMEKSLRNTLPISWYVYDDGCIDPMLLQYEEPKVN